MVYYDLLTLRNNGTLRTYLDMLTRDQRLDLEVTADIFIALKNIDGALALRYAQETEVTPIDDDKKWLFGLE